MRSQREVYLSTMLGAIDMMRSGTTSALDHVRISPDIDSSALDMVAQAWLDSGMRVVIAPVVADRAVIDTLPFDVDDVAGVDLNACGSRPTLSARAQIDIVEDFYRRWHGTGGGRISVAIGPSGPQRCSDDLLVAAADFSRRHDSILHMHVLETRLQQQMGHRLYGRGMIAHLDDLGLLGRRTNLVHSIWLEEGDIEKILAADAAVVHNPVSNARLGSGYCPLSALLAEGVRIGLGTDSACCNDSANLLETMKWAALLHRPQNDDETSWLGPRQALRLGTSAGAGTIGLSRTGRIAPGYCADLTFLCLKSPAFQPLNDAVRQLVMSESGSAIDMVMVAGELVVKGGRSVAVDEAAIWQEAAEFAGRHRAGANATSAAAHVLDKPIRKMRQRYGALWAGGCSCH
jgi:guanine deaminase